jgi:bifunctional UDP-N-acetylglucosamine pyrophosphorylase/glucosamine-1-phosphate N-acetyltransferase
MPTRRLKPPAARPLAAIVLAAGEGKRFKSKTPKVLHHLCGRPLVGYALRALEDLAPAKTVLVVGRDADDVKAKAKELTPLRLGFAVQERRLGTADAARVGDEALGRFGGDVLIIPGDTPLLDPATLDQLVAHHRISQAAATLLTADFDDPTGYGRVVRDAGGVLDRIVEHADATEAEREITECATSVYVFDRAALRMALTKVEKNNTQGELYLTDTIHVLRSKGELVEALTTLDAVQALGVNSRAQLAEVQAILRDRINERWMADGVTIEDPATTYIDAGVTLGRDTILKPGTHLHGATRVGEDCEIGPNVILKDTTVGRSATIVNAVAREATIGNRVSVGPYASLRPGTVLEDGSKAGTFVEIKASRVGDGSKVPHLSYIGDATIGKNVNIGAGTITCNYDGETHIKSRTVIGDDVLIGSDTMLVAPVTVGKGAVTGAGSVVTRDVPPNRVVVGAPAKVVRKRKSKGGRRT